MGNKIERIKLLRSFGFTFASARAANEGIQTPYFLRTLSLLLSEE